MTDNLSVSDLADVLTALQDFTEPYQLGIQLNINLSTLKAIEKNHRRDINRQKTEVIEYWLHNLPDASWTTLANAVARMGGHARLIEDLRGRMEEQNIEEPFPSSSRQYKSRTRYILSSSPRPIYVESGMNFNVLLLGKMGHGKSTLGNRMVNYDGCFKINSQEFPQAHNGSALLTSVSQCKNYKINVHDYDGLFEDANSIDTLFYEIPDVLDLVIFVLKQGRSFDEDSRAILKAVMNRWKISRISALVLTHCERLSEEERGEMIEQFKKDRPSVAELMGKGILAVGFPDNFHVQHDLQLSQRVEDDEKKLRQLIYLCDERVNIVSYPQNDMRCCSQCSIS